MWAEQKPAEQPQQSNDKQKFSKLYEMPGVEEKLLKYQQKENEKKEQLLKEQKEKEQKEQLEKDKKLQEKLLKNQQPNEILQKIKNKNSKVFDLFSKSQSQQTQETSTVKPEEQQESNKRKREDDNDLNEKQKKKCTEKAKDGGNQSSPAFKPTAFDVLSEAAKDTAKFAQALGNGLVEGASEAVKVQLEFIKDLATKPLETLEKEYVTPLKEILKDIILSGEFNEGFYSLSNSETRKKALDHFGKDFVDNVEKFKTTWNMANNLQRAEITGRIVGGIIANKKLNDLGKSVFSGGIKSGFSQEKILVDGLNNGSNIEKDLAEMYKKTTLGRGSTGRTIPQNLKEQIAMKEVLSNPLAGAKELTSITMTDQRWLAQDGWVKMSKNVNGIEIHYLRNTLMKDVFDDFKFK